MVNVFKAEGGRHRVEITIQDINEDSLKHTSFIEYVRINNTKRIAFQNTKKPHRCNLRATLSNTQAIVNSGKGFKCSEMGK